VEDVELVHAELARQAQRDRRVEAPVQGRLVGRVARRNAPVVLLRRLCAQGDHVADRAGAGEVAREVVDRVRAPRHAGHERPVRAARRIDDRPAALERVRERGLAVDVQAAL